jgi:hypothetical protein
MTNLTNQTGAQVSDFNFDIEMEPISFELTEQEIALCDSVETHQAILAETRELETQAAIAAAPNSVAAFWAGSASASVARDIKAGRVRTIKA